LADLERERAAGEVVGVGRAGLARDGLAQRPEHA